LEIRRVNNRYGIAKFILNKNSQKLSEKKYKNVYVDTCTLSSNSCFNIGNKIENSNNIVFHQFIDLSNTITNVYHMRKYLSLSPELRFHKPRVQSPKLLYI